MLQYVVLKPERKELGQKGHEIAAIYRTKKEVVTKSSYEYNDMHFNMCTK